MRPNFLTINYARGSAGKFLMSLLMASDSAAHYDKDVVTKQDKINYIKRSFVSDMSNWLLNEPSDKLAWNINFVSNTYPRGNDLSIEEFDNLCKLHCTEHFNKSVAEGKRIIIPWHKEVLPLFLGKDLLSIALNKSSMKWFAKAVWAKHYGIVDGKIHLKENDPNYYQATNARFHDRYKNPVYLDQTFYSFVKQNIYCSNETKFFSNKKCLEDMKSKYILDLSDLISLEKLKECLPHIYSTFNILPVDDEIVEVGFNHWRSLHEF